MMNKRPKHKWRRTLACCLALLLSGGVLTLHGSANVVHIRAAEVALSDLPEEFDGMTVLYMADLDVTGARDVRRMEKLCAQLQTLQPDVLIVGGNVAVQSVYSRLLYGKKDAESPLRSRVFAAFAEFDAPMGKFFLPGKGDGDADALKMCAMGSGFVFISEEPQVLKRENALLGIAGGAENIAALSSKVESGQCVLMVLQSPDDAATVRINEAKDGGSWADLLLCGHTHGGLMKIGKYSSEALTLHEKESLCGWYTDAMQPMLVTSGVGSNGWNMRLGTQSEVWLIRLTRGESAE